GRWSLRACVPRRSRDTRTRGPRRERTPPPPPAGSPRSKAAVRRGESAEAWGAGLGVRVAGRPAEGLRARGAFGKTPSAAFRADFPPPFETPTPFPPTPGFSLAAPLPEKDHRETLVSSEPAAEPVWGISAGFLERFPLRRHYLGRGETQHLRESPRHGTGPT